MNWPIVMCLMCLQARWFLLNKAGRKCHNDDSVIGVNTQIILESGSRSLFYVSTLLQELASGEFISQSNTTHGLKKIEFAINLFQPGL